MGLRDEAIAAANAALEQRKDTARSFLGSLLTPAQVDDLEVVAVTEDIVVFTDGTVHLSVKDKTEPRAVCLVTDDGQGGWTRVAKIDGLTTLGKLLDPEIPA